MKKPIVVLIFLLLGLKSNGQSISKEGYGNFLLGKTSLQSINQQYPNESHSLLALGDSNHVEIITLKKEGTELFFNSSSSANLDTVYLVQIDIIKPSFGKTQNDIGIGSRLEDVLARYGNPKKGVVGNRKKSQLLIYDWITIYTHKGIVDRISLNLIWE